MVEKLKKKLSETDGSWISNKGIRTKSTKIKNTIKEGISIKVKTTPIDSVVKFCLVKFKLNLKEVIIMEVNTHKH